MIALAGAAEEILGKARREQGVKTALEDMEDNFYLFRSIRFGSTAYDEKGTDERSKSDKWLADRANSARNKAKHINPVQRAYAKY